MEAKRELGSELYRVQMGEEPHDWKPMKTVGAGVREIRVFTSDGTYRAIYVANIGDRVVVLHCFEKKSEKTPKRDIDLARTRLKEALKEIQK